MERETEIEIKRESDRERERERKKDGWKKVKKSKILKGRETVREMVRQVIFSLTGQLSDSLLGPTDKTGQVRACKHTHRLTHTHTHTLTIVSLAGNCCQGQLTGQPVRESWKCPHCVNTQTHTATCRMVLKMST